MKKWLAPLAVVLLGACSNTPCDRAYSRGYDTVTTRHGLCVIRSKETTIFATKEWAESHEEWLTSFWRGAFGGDDYEAVINAYFGVAVILRDVDNLTLGSVEAKGAADGRVVEIATNPYAPNYSSYTRKTLTDHLFRHEISHVILLYAFGKQQKHHEIFAEKGLGY